VTEVPYTTKWTTEANADDVLYVTFANGWRLELHGHYDDGVQVFVYVPAAERDEWEESEQVSEWYSIDYRGLVEELRQGLYSAGGLDALTAEVRWPVSEFLAPVAEHASGDEPRCVDREQEQQSLTTFSQTPAGDGGE